MKSTDWYTRTLLTLLVALLSYIAAELRMLNSYQAALASSIQATEARQARDFRPTTVALHQPNTSLLLPSTEPINVRIVGFRYNNTVKDLGDDYSYNAHGLPVMTVK